VMHPALFVERRHRLGSGEPSAGGPHHQEGHIRINYAGRFDRLAAESARTAIAVYRARRADRVVAEVNNGG
jgi:phage terminase large subunit-like protein